MQVDSIRVQTQDTTSIISSDSIVPAIPPAHLSADTNNEPVVREQTITQPVQIITAPQKNESKQEARQETPIQSVTKIEQNSIIEKKEVIHNEYLPFSLYSNLISDDSSTYKHHFRGAITNDSTIDLKTELRQVVREKVRSTEKGWVFGLAVFSTFLLIIVRVYFHKYLSTIIASFVNFQLAEKLIREKNILVRRVFTLLNINFLIATSLYIYLIIKRVGVYTETLNDFFLFIFILAILFSVLFVRLIILNIVAALFDSQPLFREFIHNTYLLNKNLGLYLLPMVISVFYLSSFYAEIIFYLCTILVIISFIYRYLRSLQIILKHKVLYFYTILYLCTLEILPALVGIKFVLSLR